MSLISRKHNPELAKKCFDLAKSHLLKAAAYGLIDKYLQAEPEYKKIVKKFQDRGDELIADAPKMPEVVRKMILEGIRRDFEFDVATLVALLSKLGCNSEAENICAAAEKEWSDEEFRVTLRKAKKGDFPSPDDGEHYLFGLGLRR